MIGPSVRVLGIALLGAALSSCSAKLSEPVRIPETQLVVIEKQQTVTGANRTVCEQKLILDFKSLPVGPPYTLDMKPGPFGWFAANQFAVEFFDSGQMKSVTLNSDPQLDETIASTANLVKEVAGAVATVAPAAALATADAKGDCAPALLRTTETVRCVVPFSRYETLGGCPAVADP